MTDDTQTRVSGYEYQLICPICGFPNDVKGYAEDIECGEECSPEFGCGAVLSARVVVETRGDGDE